MKVKLRPVEWPTFTTADDRFEVSSAEYDRRCIDAYARSGTDWLVVYGDREHWGNIGFLTGFDPRFEEAVLLIGPGGVRALVVGNEGLIHSAVMQIPLDVVLCQSFSLMGQPRTKAPNLVNVLRDVGMTPGGTASIVGWKYLEPEEVDGQSRPAFVPALIVDSIARATGTVPGDATTVLMNPVDGLRSRVSAAQIASWEYAAVHAARAVFDVIDATRPGVTEHEAVQAMMYQGSPLSTHVMFASGKGHLNGLSSPSSKRVEAGDAVTTAIGFWGGLTCRAGIVSDTSDSFLENVAFPYFQAIVAWYSTMAIGVTGGGVWDVIMDALADVEFAPLLNPGHLIGHEEWTHTPIREASADPLLSGMTMQCDIIPSPLPRGCAINAEDTIVLADAELRSELATGFPDLWSRIQQRRTRMKDQLGIALSDDVLPLSPTCGYLPPLWQAPTLACSID